MAAITSYLDLKTAVQQWLNRNDASAINAIPLCISFAEQDFQRTFKLPVTEQAIAYVADGTSGTDHPSGPLVIPNDYFGMKNFTVNGKSFYRTSVETFNKIKAVNDVQPTIISPDDSYYVTQKKNFFVRIGNEIHTSPEIQAGDSVQMIYYQEITPMAKDADAPPSLEIAPDLMLYLSLRHAAVFLRDNDQAQFWEQKASDAGGRLQMHLDEIEWDGSSIEEYRTRQSNV